LRELPRSLGDGLLPPQAQPSTNIVSVDDVRAAMKRTADYVSTLPTERNVVELETKKKQA